MKKLIFGMLFSSAILVFGSCESQRTSTSETTTTAEKVTADQIPPPDTTTTGNTSGNTTNNGSDATNQPDAGEISAEASAAGAFVSDADFAAKAIASGLAEVKFGTLADRKAVNPEVKQFGVRMVQDHTRPNNVLTRLAQQRKWSVPSDMDVEHQQAYSKLATVMSDEFDQGYMAQMVKDHEMAVAMFQQASTQASDAELKSFAASTLPNLKMHLGMARDLQKKVEASR